MGEVYRITRIEMEGNEHGELKSGVIYAELRDSEGALVISASLEHILEQIRDRRLACDGVSVTWSVKRGVHCSTVRLDRYGVG